MGLVCKFTLMGKDRVDFFHIPHATILRYVRLSFIQTYERASERGMGRGRRFKMLIFVCSCQPAQFAWLCSFRVGIKQRTYAAFPL